LVQRGGKIFLIFCFLSIESIIVLLGLNVLLKHFKIILQNLVETLRFVGLGAAVDTLRYLTGEGEGGGGGDLIGSKGS